MKAFGATLVMASLAFAAAQLTLTRSPAATGFGPLDLAPAAAGGMTPNTGGAGALPAGGGLLANDANPATMSTTNTANGKTNPMQQMFRNPLMNYGLMGGDNLRRAFMLPYLSRLGGSNTASYYYLRGGMDKYANVMMSDMISRMLAQSTGMNPMLTSMFASQLTDAPDNYVLNNMFLNRRGAFGGGGGSGSSGNAQAQGMGLLPAGGASPFQRGASGMFSGFNPLALASLSMM
ncbi:hypothetical protein ACOMHN_043847 [Nucella lapillus]